VVGIGPQLGFIIPLTTAAQGYLNLKGYKEFASRDRPDDWNTWGHIRDLAGGTDADRPAATNAHEIASLP